MLVFLCWFDCLFACVCECVSVCLFLYVCKCATFTKFFRPDEKTSLCDKQKLIMAYRLRRYISYCSIEKDFEEQKIGGSFLDILARRQLLELFCSNSFYSLLCENNCSNYFDRIHSKHFGAQLKLFSSNSF